MIEKTQLSMLKIYGGGLCPSDQTYSWSLNPNIKIKKIMEHSLAFIVNRAKKALAL